MFLFRRRCLLCTLLQLANIISEFLEDKNKCASRLSLRDVPEGEFENFHSAVITLLYDMLASFLRAKYAQKIKTKYSLLLTPITASKRIEAN